MLFKRLASGLLGCTLGTALVPPGGATELTERIEAQEQDPIRIGVLAYRGKAQALARWSPTANYLSRVIADHRFEIVPLNLDEIARVIENAGIHFTLTNPGNYVDLESRFGASRIATLQTRASEEIRVRFGAVIVTRADNAEINTLEDLRGKSFMAVSAQAFGGFQMAWRELKEHNIDPFRHLGELRFVGFPQDKIIFAVYNGTVDAATVRVETLVHMIESGKVPRDALRILNAQPQDHHAYPRSTRLYPEWPFATLKNTPRRLATRVTQALLSMPADHPAAHSSRTAGWTIPLDYSPVHELMRVLQIGPYEVLRQTSPLAMVKRYSPWFAGAGFMLLLLIFLNGYISRTNHRLKDTERSLRREIVGRERSQAALARYRDTLEEQVATRTEDLRTTNLALEKSRVALRELVKITSAPDLSHDEKLARLLDTGRAYYGLPVAVLASIEQGRQRACKISGDATLVRTRAGPLNQHCAAQLIERGGQPLDIPDMDKHSGGDCISLKNGWKSYLGAAVLVEGHLHCTLEFAGIEVRPTLLSQWDLELLKVMAQWIGDELERQLACEAEQRHQAEFAHVSRINAIGELAASLAHELNQPLTGAINYSSGCLRLLRSGKVDPEKLAEGIQRTIEGATLAADIIRHIREFVQKGDTELSPLDLNTAVRNVTTLITLEARRRNVDLVLDLAPDLPPVNGNMIQLEQVILNFIRNGVDAMDGLNGRQHCLTVTTRHIEGTVQLTAMDTGEGIAKESLNKIFDAFYTTKPDGMGIGLSVSRSIVESHHGRIMARSRSGNGAEFTFELPVAERA